VIVNFAGKKGGDVAPPRAGLRLIHTPFIPSPTVLPCLLKLASMMELYFFFMVINLLCI
jgi:hypothetical protein